MRRVAVAYQPANCRSLLASLEEVKLNFHIFFKLLEVTHRPPGASAAVQLLRVCSAIVPNPLPAKYLSPAVSCRLRRPRIASTAQETYRQ